MPETGGSRIRNLLGMCHGDHACDVGSGVDSVDVRNASEDTLLHSRAGRGGNDAHTRVGGETCSETQQPPFASVPRLWTRSCVESLMLVCLYAAKLQRLLIRASPMRGAKLA